VTFTLFEFFTTITWLAKFLVDNHCGGLTVVYSVKHFTDW